ncbi:regulatory protein MarR [Pseudanabaena biceps PCC 7429]|uniref:Regulatory protein MarR n=1 Tax=Pseudanabaena biceps PCC 7429 TaxID=927668 RepID=L8N1M2_9CYAN|nr:regulatory protein MarR [Pseudanabaena biceps PCC 7429]
MRWLFHPFTLAALALLSISYLILYEHLGVTCATASSNTERLVQRNFVHRCDHPSERRRVSLKLTTEGKEHLDAARDLTRAYIADLLDSLSEEQIAKIDASLALLHQVFESKSTLSKSTL